MADIRLNVRDAERSVHTITDASWCDAIVASLVCEPELLGEVRWGLSRFFRPAPKLFEDWQPGLCEEPWADGVVIIDLAARLLVHDLQEHRLLPSGEYAWHVNDEPTDKWLPYEVPPEWLIQPLDQGWRELAERRRAERAPRVRLDVRRVFYDQLPLDLARACLESASRGETDPDDQVIRRIHADWLLTPRDELLGETPRALFLLRQDAIRHDIDRQARAWTVLGEEPPGLDRQSLAYQYGLFGTHEYVLHYELVRHLLEAGWTAARDRRPPSVESLTECLRVTMRQWLRTVQQELSYHTPAEVIDRERMRLPMCDTPGEDGEGVAQGRQGDSHGDAHDDCPLCKMLARSGTPSFWFLDGGNMDPDFAFSMWSTREEWEAEQQLWDDWDRDLAERARARAESGGDHRSDDEGSLWRSCYFNEAFLETVSPAVGVQVLMFDIGAKLVELREDLGPVAVGKQLSARLLDHFESLQAAYSDGSAWQIQTVRNHFASTFESLVGHREDLKAKSADVQNQLDRLLEFASALRQQATRETQETQETVSEPCDPAGQGGNRP